MQVIRICKTAVRTDELVLMFPLRGKRVVHVLMSDIHTPHDTRLGQRFNGTIEIGDINARAELLRERVD